MGFYLISGDVLEMTRKHVRLHVTVVKDAEGVYGSIDYDDEISLPLKAFPAYELRKLAECQENREGFEEVYCRTALFDDYC